MFTVYVNSERFKKKMRMLRREVRETAKLWTAYSCGQALKAALPFVPVDTGTLKKSGRVGPVVAQRQQYTCYVAFGGRQPTHPRRPFGPIYAIRVHQDLQMPHPRGGSAKYLEKGWLQVREGIVPTLRKLIGDDVSKVNRA